MKEANEKSFLRRFSVIKLLMGEFFPSRIDGEAFARSACQTTICHSDSSDFLIEFVQDGSAIVLQPFASL